MKKNFYIFILIFFTFGLVFWLGIKTANEKALEKKRNVNSQIILDKIQDQYFLVTKSLFLDSSAEINLTNTSGWKNLFIKDSINARGVIRIDNGLDMSSLTVDDILVDKLKNIITVNLPQASIFDSSLFGNLDIETKKGVLTK